MSVIKLSDLYSVSLDELLKEDKKLFIGADKGWNRLKWLMVLAFGAANLLTGVETFGIKWLSTLENVTASDFFSTFEPLYFIIGAVVSAAGIGIGTAVRSSKFKKRTE